MADNDWAVLDTRSEQTRVLGVVHQRFALSQELDAYPWNLKLSIRFIDLKPNGWPTRDENEAASNEENALTELLESTGHVRYFGRRTERDERETIYRLDDPDTARPIIEQFVSDPRCRRISDYTITPDPERNELEWYFELLDTQANVNRRDPA